MSRPDEELTAETARPSDLVTAPILKFAIGAVASLCAVLVPRLLASLATRDQANITFITREYAELAVLLSSLVGIVVAILEWRVPRAPRDTFMTTLGIPAILAGALSANQNAGALQSATRTQELLADKLGQASGIAIESPTTTGPGKSGQEHGQLIDVLVPPVYASSAQTTGRPIAAPSSLAIRINQPQYLIVLDRAVTRQEAETKASQLTQRLAATPGQPLPVQVQQQDAEFLVVVGGGAHTKADALLEAIRVKNTYHLNPTLVGVPRN